MDNEYGTMGQAGGQQPVKKKSGDMATASMVLGIAGIVTSCCCCLGMVLSSLALILGLLTRTEQEMEPNAKIGVITGGVGLAISIMLMIGWFCLMMFSSADTDFYAVGSLLVQTLR